MISLILRMPAATPVLTLPEQAAPQARLTLDEINAAYPSEEMPNSRVYLGQKILDLLCDDTAEGFVFPPSWLVIYMAKLVPVIHDDLGNALNDPWQVITPLHTNFINHLNDVDDVGTRPGAAFENHRFMGMPARF